MQQGNEQPHRDDSAEMASIVPNVPRCGEPATVRIEIYSPRDGMAHGVLDGVLYACATHADDIVEVVGWDPTGTLTTYRTELRHQAKACGSGWDFVREAGEIAHAGAQSAIEIRQLSTESDAEIRRSVTDLVGDDEQPIATALEAYELGQAVERRRAEAQAEEDLELLERIDRRLRAAAAKHAFTVRELGDGSGNYLWSCICGGETIVQFRDDEGDIREKLAAHLKAQTPEVER